MKFAKDLEEHLVPEWRTRYFNYKQGKKKIKAITNALRNANRAGRTPTFLGKSPRTSSRNGLLVGGSGPTSTQNGSDVEAGHSNQPERISRRLSEPLPNVDEDSSTQQSAPLPIAKSQTHQEDNDQYLTRYGSIVGTPPDNPLTRAESLNLGDPALDLERRLTAENAATLEQRRDRAPSVSIEPTVKPSVHKHTRWASLSLPKRSDPDGLFGMRPGFPQARSHEAPLFRRMMNRYRGRRMSTPIADIPLEARQEVDNKYEDFLVFLDGELDKIERFYVEREKEATRRLHELRHQLHTLRDQRAYEIFKLKEVKAQKLTHAHQHKKSHDGPVETAPTSPSVVTGVLKHPLEAMKAARRLGTAHPTHIKPTYLATPPSGAANDPRRDYQRRPAGTANIEYRKAKRQLKVAMHEFYRGLELLRGYGESNRTAFRKINKKFDKAIQAEKKLRYYNDRITVAHFVQSDLVEKYMRDVEDLYGRYFENGNRKAAERRLRSKHLTEGDYNSNMFLNGLLLGVGSTFGVYSLVFASNLLLHDPDPNTRTTTSYLLQIYAGYFLMLFLALLFCLDCWFMTVKKINYPFIFEFDIRHMLNWRQLLELPLFFYFLLGLFMWLNFKQVGGEAMYIYWPVVLVGITFITLFFPARILYHRSRSWFLESAWRLFFSFIYPVEFRDFFLGDLFCSLTYSMGNIELFFCLYAHQWGNPGQCNSGSSRLLGFFTTLPGIWRALQCLRRFWDTGAIFPHLVNCGKYICTILYYMTLSLYRIDHSVSNQAVFIFFAAANGIYTTTWDLFIDWSLMNTGIKYPLLREELPYRRPWYYYSAMVIDIVIRQNWIFYAIFAEDLQHSAILSFFVAFSEVFRRGIWVLFRVENEHTTNVLLNRAHKDKPLPYPRESTDELLPREEGAGQDGTDLGSGATSTSIDPVATSPSLRRRYTNKVSPSLRRAGTIIRGAHAQDYERRKVDQDEAADEDDDDDEDEDDAYVEEEAEHEAEHQVEVEQQSRSNV